MYLADFVEDDARVSLAQYMLTSHQSQGQQRISEIKQKGDSITKLLKRPDLITKV